MSPAIGPNVSTFVTSNLREIKNIGVNQSNTYTKSRCSLCLTGSRTPRCFRLGIFLTIVNIYDVIKFCKRATAMFVNTTMLPLIAKILKKLDS